MTNEKPENTPKAAISAIARYLTLICVAVCILSTFELFFLLTGSQTAQVIQIPLIHFIAGTFASSWILITLHIVPILLISSVLNYTIPARFHPQKKLWILIIIAFGFAWQNTLLTGAGIRAQTHFNTIRTLLTITAPTALYFLAWLCFWNPKTSPKNRTNILLILLAAGLLFNTNILLSYREFHGFLAIFNTSILLYLLTQITNHKNWARIANLCAITITIALIITSLQWNDTIRHTIRYSIIPAALSTLPLGDIISPPTDPLFQKYLSKPYDLVQGPPLPQNLNFQNKLDQRTQNIGQKQLGNNILLIVLESVRWDYWEDPILTPNFHKWKDNGLYLPNAVTPYPATPLAYGAIFTSQPPSVLALTNYWSSHRLFDVISASFKNLWLTQPDNHWFSNDAITSFFVPPNITPNEHINAPNALSYLQNNLINAADQSFFAWAHLYDPHAPFELNTDFDRGGRHEIDRAYRSQIASLDEHLGQFMDWFFQQPFAQNTLVVVVADHGQAMGETIQGKSFMGHHEHVHNLISRVPMFLAGPGIPTNTVNPNLAATHLDIMPTVFDFLGIPIPFELQPQGESIYHLIEQPADRTIITEAFAIRGEDFFDFIRGSGREREQNAMFLRYQSMNHRNRSYSPKIALQHGPWKLTYDRFSLQYWLHNIQDDPLETQNLSAQQPIVFESLQQKLELWLFEQSWIIKNLHELP